MNVCSRHVSRCRNITLTFQRRTANLSRMLPSWKWRECFRKRILVSDEETCCGIRTREGRESIEDDRSSGCPQASSMAENMEKVFQAERKRGFKQ
ncbi:hypothetical protein TNCV_3823311 [Trichonephila clavipes]|nr:hypothetical protein TNCV_3823311 [Trichonephila clavipes]